MTLKVNFTQFVAYVSIIFASANGLLGQNANNASTNISTDAIGGPTIPVQLYEPVEEGDSTTPVGIIVFIVFITVFLIAISVIIPMCYGQKSCCHEDCCNDQCFNEVCCGNACTVVFEDERRNYTSNNRLVRRDSTRIPITSGSLSSTPDVSNRIQQHMRQLDRLRTPFPSATPAIEPEQTPPPSYSAAVKEDWKYPRFPKPQSGRTDSSNSNVITEMPAVSSENFAVSEISLIPRVSAVPSAPHE